MSEPSTDRVAAFIASHELDAEIISTPGGVPTVELAAAALGVPVDQIIKTLVFVSSDERLVIAIASGMGRVDRKRLSAATGTTNLKLASPELVLASTGYPAGGVAPIDLPAGVPVIVDTLVAQRQEVYGGSGTDLHMMRIRAEDIIRLNHARIAGIVQQDAT